MDEVTEAQVRKSELELGQEGEPGAGSAGSRSFSSYSSAPVLWPCVWVRELFLDVLGPLGAVFPQLWGGPAAPPTSIPSPWARWTLVL